MRKVFFKFVILVLLFVISNSYSDNLCFTTLTFDSLQKNKTYSLIDNWLYHAGDNPLWKNPDYPDSTWEMVDPRLLREILPRTGWPRCPLPSSSATETPECIGSWDSTAASRSVAGGSMGRTSSCVSMPKGRASRCMNGSRRLSPGSASGDCFRGSWLRATRTPV